MPIQEQAASIIHSLPASPRPCVCAQVPTQEQAASVTKELQARSQLPPQVARVLAAMPRETHPMTQLSQAVLALQVGEGGHRSALPCN